MTLANFNSNFNWQYRMLKEAAECCGIVPDLPPAPPPPVVDCYWYAKLHDGTCSQFSTFTADWTLNGVDVFSGWYILMVAPPYGTVGEAIQYTDNLSGCSNIIPNDYYFWTVVPSTTLSLPQLTGNDGNGNPIVVDMFGPICTRKCYSGIMTSLTGSTFINAINTTELNATDYSIFVDLAPISAGPDFTAALGQFYPKPPLDVQVDKISGNEFSITINGLYSLGTEVYVYLDDGVSAATLTEIPC